MFYTDDVVFVHISLTGGRSISSAFGQPSGAGEFNGQCIPAHATADEIKAIMGEDEWNRRWSFSVVRNPWDKMVSVFHSWCRDFKLQKHWGEQWQEIYDLTRDFRSFVHFYPNGNMHGMTAPLRTPQMYWARGVDDIFKYEEFDVLSAAMRERGYDGNIPLVARRDVRTGETYHRPGNPYQEYYDNESVELVRGWFREDIETFGYTF